MIPWGCWYSRLTARRVKRTGFVRRIREDGSVVMPWSVLQVAKLRVGDTVELLMDGKDIVLRKKKPEDV